MMRITIMPMLAMAIVFTSVVGLPKPAAAQVVDETSVASVDQSSMLPRAARNTLKRIFKESIVGSQLVMPEETQIASFKKLIEKTLGSRTVDSELKLQWEQEGWECRSVSDSNLIIVVEKSDQRWGRGIYAIRAGSSSQIVLQAPHRFNDAKTGVIARKIFEEHDVWAVAFNTVHRKELDLAHCERHYFNAFTEAVVALRARSVMLQLHGFSNATKTNAGRSANMIVSDTTKFPGRYARRVAEEFKFNFGKSHTRLYPLETRWLGGTNNHQANLVQQLGSVGFLHLEMNPSFRQQLASTASVREQFFASILAGIGQ